MNPQANDLVTCPLDNSHRILRSRMQFHIVRCLKNHKLETKMRCPWNPLHFVEKCEYLDHCYNKCENLVTTMGSRITMKEGAEGDVASIPVGATNDIVPPSTEDWDAEPFVGTYDPLKRSENRPILRGSIGLSKAKKKEFRLQERRRHQQLANELPIQIKATSKPDKESDVPKSCRKPHNQSIAMSADTSMMDELNSSKVSDDCDKISKWPADLRQPHGLSPGLFYKAAEEKESKEKTLFDRQFEDSAETGSEYSVSSTRSRTAVHKKWRKAIEESYKNPEKHSAAVVSSEVMKKSNDEPIEVQEISVQDGAACLPQKIAIPLEMDDDVEKLTEKLANLETLRKQLDEQKAKLLQKLVENKKNDDVGPNKENFSHNIKQQCFTGINRKCAAGLGSAQKAENSPIRGFGRGIPFDLETLQKWKPFGICENQQDSAELVGSTAQNGDSME